MATIRLLYKFSTSLHSSRTLDLFGIAGRQRSAGQCVQRFVRSNIDGSHGPGTLHSCVTTMTPGSGGSSLDVLATPCLLASKSTSPESGNVFLLMRGVTKPVYARCIIVETHTRLYAARPAAQPSSLAITISEAPLLLISPGNTRDVKLFLLTPCPARSMPCRHTTPWEAMHVATRSHSLEASGAPQEALNLILRICL